MAEPSDLLELKNRKEKSPTAILEGLMTRMNQVLTKNQIQPQTPMTNFDSIAAHIDIKLYSTNYALWYQVVEMYISEIDKLIYINGDLP